MKNPLYILFCILLVCFWHEASGAVSFEYHLKDHLGSTRVAFVLTASGTEVVQENSYYPFGAPIADLSWSPKSTNRYKREGKEYISDFDWNKYDFTGRTFDTWTLRALQVDPMAEKYYGSSPYALWVNNPVRVIDPTGMWTEDGNRFMDVLKQIASFFGIGKKPEDDEQAREYAERREALQNYNKDMKARVDKGQEVADYIPFVGAAFDMSDGMVNHDDATFATGLGVFVLDAAGGELLKGAGKAVAKGVTVLGKYPNYINLASEIGAKRFNIPTNIWNKMTAADQWIANVKFLDRAIERGDIIVLSNRVTNISNVTGSFRRELDYLISKGYKLSSNGLQMIK